MLNRHRRNSTSSVREATNEGHRIVCAGWLAHRCDGTCRRTDELQPTMCFFAAVAWGARMGHSAAMLSDAPVQRATVQRGASVQFGLLFCGGGLPNVFAGAIWLVLLLPNSRGACAGTGALISLRDSSVLSFGSAGLGRRPKQHRDLGTVGID